MTSPQPFAHFEGTVNRKADTARERFLERPLIDQLRKGWSSVALGIIMAGGAYPIVASIIGAAIVLVVETPPIPDIVAAGFIGAILWFVLGLTGMVWINAVLVVTLPAMLLVVWSLRVRVSIIWCGAFWGGLVGFLAVLPLLSEQAPRDNILVGLAFGPALTTVLGQLGGAWGGRRAIHRADWYQRALDRASVKNAGEAPTSTESRAEVDDSLVKPMRFQFGIRHLMWSAVWISLLLSLLRLLGAPLEIALPFLGGWIVYQAATLWIGGQLLRRLGPWYADRQPAVPRGTTGKADAACAFHVEHATGRSLPNDVTREVVSRETE